MIKDKFMNAFIVDQMINKVKGDFTMTIEKAEKVILRQIEKIYCLEQEIESLRSSVEFWMGATTEAEREMKALEETMMAMRKAQVPVPLPLEDIDELQPVC